jgi:CTP synthase
VPHTKFIVVTGGVLSGLGKGVASASLGRLLSQYKVVPVKLDGYLNVDPGTMNPIEHGEVFVLDDGGEVDMDFGHYERFLGITCKFDWNLTMGKVFDAIRKKERRGDYLGQTVQYIPHVVDHIKEHILATAKTEHADVVLIEVGGTIGDMENELYVEACRQLKKAVGHENVVYVHLTYIPVPSGVHEQKSKPTQQSVSLLRERGIQPDIIIGRCKERLSDKIKKKIAIFCDVDEDAVITGEDTDNVYKIPGLFHDEGITKILERKLGIPISPPLAKWHALLTRKPEKAINIAICGKYTKLEDSYASVVEALKHAAMHEGAQIKLHWIETTDVEQGKRTAHDAISGMHGVIVPGGFGARGAEGKIDVIRLCRERKIPYLGLCYGLQLAVIEYARDVKGLANANSTEIDPNTPHPVIDLLPDQHDITEKGATMRLGGHDVRIKKGTKAHAMFGDTARLRFRHRYEVVPSYVPKLADGTLVFSGTNKSGEIMQILELAGHPFFMATQAHPELTSSLDRPSPFFHEFVKAALGKG